MNTEPMKGGCLCGAVSYELTPPTDFAAHCHCGSCRQASGAAFLTWTSAPREHVRVRGKEQVRWFVSSDSIRWGFCSECGTTLFYSADSDGHPEAPKTDRLYVTVGSLRSTLDREPTMHVSYEEHVSWFTPGDHLPRHKGKTKELCATSGVHLILYVADQQASRSFYEAVLGTAPSLDVPGMTEFELPGGAVLGLMPEAGIQRLLGPKLVVGGSTASRAEVYLRVLAPQAMHERALAAGAEELSPRSERSWGEWVSYVRDADGHILALAGPSRNSA